LNTKSTKILEEAIVECGQLNNS